MRAHGISGRESDVLRHVADGLTNREIAQQLHLSPRTVQRHLASVYDKLGVRTRAGVVYLIFSGDSGVPARDLY